MRREEDSSSGVPSVLEQGPSSTSRAYPALLLTSLPPSFFPSIALFAPGAGCGRVGHIAAGVGYVCRARGREGGREGMSDGTLVPEANLRDREGGSEEGRESGKEGRREGQGGCGPKAGTPEEQEGGPEEAGEGEAEEAGEGWKEGLTAAAAPRAFASGPRGTPDRPRRRKRGRGGSPILPPFLSRFLPTTAVEPASPSLPPYLFPSLPPSLSHSRCAAAWTGTRNSGLPRSLLTLSPPLPPTLPPSLPPSLPPRARRSAAPAWLLAFFPPVGPTG